MWRHIYLENNEELKFFLCSGLPVWFFFRCIYSNFLNRPRNTPAFHESYHLVFQWLLFVPIVQYICKVFTVLHVFHIFLCYSLISKQYPIITMSKVFFFLSFQIYIYKQCISIHNLCSILCWGTFGTNYSLESSV